MTKQQAKKKKYCIECESEDKKRIAHYECCICEEGYCTKCEKSLMGECTQCPPPQLYKIKK